LSSTDANITAGLLPYSPRFHSFGLSPIESPARGLLLGGIHNGKGEEHKDLPFIWEKLKEIGLDENMGLPGPPSSFLWNDRAATKYLLPSSLHFSHALPHVFLHSYSSCAVVHMLLPKGYYMATASPVLTNPSVHLF